MEYTDIELKNEKWKDIDGYDGAYQVSDLGRVRSLKFGKTRVLIQQKNRYGYLKVLLWKDGKRKSLTVHRLVAQAFIPNDDDTKIYINHRDECKQNNKVSNLEWCTAQYNMTYNDIHHRRWINRSDYKQDKIAKLYDPNLSINENIDIFKANGIECCRDTVVKLRKDLGLTKQYKPRKTKQVNELIN